MREKQEQLLEITNQILDRGISPMSHARSSDSLMTAGTPASASPEPKSLTPPPAPIIPRQRPTPPHSPRGNTTQTLANAAPTLFQKRFEYDRNIDTNGVEEIILKKSELQATCDAIIARIFQNLAIQNPRHPEYQHIYRDIRQKLERQITEAIALGVEKINIETIVTEDGFSIIFNQSDVNEAKPSSLTA